jgi:hypothetical protein
MMARFEERLSAQIAVAFFIPAIVYLADAVGTQTEALVVRGLSFNAPRLSRLLTGEVATGSMIGAMLGAIALPLAYIGFGDVRLALAVALAIFVAGSLADRLRTALPMAALARRARSGVWQRTRGNGRAGRAEPAGVFMDRSADHAGVVRLWRADQKKGRRRAATSLQKERRDQLLPIAIFLSFALTSGGFGTVTVSIPFANDALI